MYSTITALLNRLDSPAFAGTGVIKWGCPVPTFGDPANARIATLGINPSNREFVDQLGKELDGRERRFHTLKSLGLSKWAEADLRHIEQITESCTQYFQRNPYNLWFKRLEYVVAAMKATFYGAAPSACHLDLVPYATAHKWTELSSRQRTSLFAVSKDALARILVDAPVSVLILNGRSVVKHFQLLTGVCLHPQHVHGWRLKRRSSADISGIAYMGTTEVLSGLDLGRRILILGFNHNLQSSYGVTADAINAIRTWLAHSSEEVLA